MESWNLQQTGSASYFGRKDSFGAENCIHRVFRSPVRFATCLMAQHKRCAPKNAILLPERLHFWGRIVCAVFKSGALKGGTKNSFLQKSEVIRKKFSYKFVKSQLYSHFV